MPIMATYREYETPILKQETAVTYIQAAIRPSFMMRLTEICAKNHWTKSSVVRAALEKFIDDEYERQSKRPPLAVVENNNHERQEQKSNLSFGW